MGIVFVMSSSPLKGVPFLKKVNSLKLRFWIFSSSLMLDLSLSALHQVKHPKVIMGRTIPVQMYDAKISFILAFGTF